jgi:hypothetical protein
LEEFSDKRNTASANLTKKWESQFLSSGSSNSDVSIILQIISHDKGMVEAVGPGPALDTGGGMVIEEIRAAMATVIVVAAAMLGVDAANLRKQDNSSS